MRMLSTKYLCSTSSVIMKLLPLSLLLLIHAASTVAAHNTYTDVFSSVAEEYDALLMDPNHVFGSPMGGWSRATASRLASLKLPLPAELFSETTTETEAEEPNQDIAETDAYHTMVRDYEGRLYVCRVYSQDELTGESLQESFLNVPQLLSEDERDATASTKDVQKSRNNLPIYRGIGQEEDQSSAAASTSSSEKASQELNSKQNGDDGEASSSTSAGAKTVEQQIAEAHKRLETLNHICAQWHDGWWSYEWCNRDTLSQFHVHVEQLVGGARSAAGDNIQLQDITKLGKFSGRKVVLMQNDNVNGHSNDGDDDEANPYAEGEAEFARVVDSYTDGEICPDTGKPRVAQVTIRCCSPRIMRKFKGGVLYKGKPHKTTAVALARIREQDPPNNCIYNATICTPLLCENYGQGEATTVQKMGLSDSKAKERMNKVQSSLEMETKELEDLQNIEDMSIRSILKYALGKDGTTCLQQITGGWWTYEVCYGRHVRQYRESIVLDSATGVASSKVETEYILGRYDAQVHEESLEDQHEWEYIVNATDNGGLTASQSGNGAYFYQEYTGGDVCEDPDVTDSAIKAGSVQNGGIERASTVRYSCGPALKVTVSEDSTCHYIVDIAVPLLCEHPLFKAPASTQQVMKCLPAVAGSHRP